MVSDARPLGGPAPHPETTAAPPARRLDHFGGAEITRVGIALAVVFGLLLILRGAVRRVGGPLAGGGRPSGVVQVIARYPVARAQQLVLLQVGSRVVLLHQTRGAMTALTEITGADEVAGLLARVEAGGPSRSPGRFHGLLQRVTERRPTPEAFPPVPEKVVVDLTRRRGRKSRLGVGT